MSSNRVPLRCEVCPICKFQIQMSIPKEDLNPGLTGLATLIDVHGIAYKDKPHVRLLYVDPHGSVRSFKAISELTGDPAILEELKNLKGMF